MKNLGNFTRNPLGIIGLFIILIYSIAGLVISSSFRYLHGNWERQPIIFFIVIFPFVVLWIFYILVTKHNVKLYSPQDFDNQEGFLIVNGMNITPNNDPQPLERPEKIPVNVNNKSVSMMTFSKYHDEKQLAEKALKKYSDNHGLAIKTQVWLSNDFVGDGVAERDGQICLFEVKVHFQPERFDSVLHVVKRIKSLLQKHNLLELHIVVILVSENNIESNLMETFKSKAKELWANIELVNYKEAELF